MLGGFVVEYHHFVMVFYSAVYSDLFYYSVIFLIFVKLRNLSCLSVEGESRSVGWVIFCPPSGGGQLFTVDQSGGLFSWRSYYLASLAGSSFFANLAIMP